MTAVLGRDALRGLLRRLVKADVAARWYVFALLYMMAAKLLAAVVHRIALGDWPAFSAEPFVLLLAATMLSTVSGGQAGEQLGWRGYVLPRLAGRFGYARASLFIGVIWAVWHLPFFHIPGTGQTGQSFPVWALSVMAISVAMTWLYTRTGGSLLLTMLMHAAVNNLGSIVLTATAGATDVWTLSAAPMLTLTMVVLWLPAAWFLATMPTPPRESSPGAGA